MAYLTRAKLKEYLGVPSDVTTEDTLLDDIITRVTGFIELYTRRIFEAPAEPSIRYFNPLSDVFNQGRLLMFDSDLLTVDEAINGDGVTLAPEDYVLLPINESPKYGMKLLASSDMYWTYETDPEAAISISAIWASYATVPPVIEQAMIRLCSYIYRQKDNAGEFDRTILAGNSTLLPTQLPRDILELLDPYVRI